MIIKLSVTSEVDIELDIQVQSSEAVIALFSQFVKDKGPIAEGVLEIPGLKIVMAAWLMQYACTQESELAAVLFQSFINQFCLESEDIHVSLERLGLWSESYHVHVSSVLRAYYEAKVYCQNKGLAISDRKPKSALLLGAQHNPMAMFGGQSGMDNYFEEARTLYATYHPLVHGFVSHMSLFLSEEATREDKFARLYSHGLGVQRWLEVPESTPDTKYMLSPSVCIPVAGLIQLMQVVVLYKTLEMSPGELRSCFAGKYILSQLLVIQLCIFRYG